MDSCFYSSTPTPTCIVDTIHDLTQMNRRIELPNIDNETYKMLSENVASQCHSVLRSNAGPIACKISQLVYIALAIIFTNFKELWANIKSRPDIFYEIYQKLTNTLNFKSLSIY